MHERGRRVCGVRQVLDASVTDASRTHLETIYAGVRATLLSVVHSYACMASRPSAPSE